MARVPVVYIFAAIIPALMVAGLYFFDHSVASQMAQQKEFNLKKPSAYHYDILLLGFMVYSLQKFGNFFHFPLKFQFVIVKFFVFRHWFVDCLDFLLQMVFFHNPPCIPEVLQFLRSRFSNGILGNFLLFCWEWLSNFLILLMIMQLIRKKMMKTAKEGIKQQATHSEIYGKMHAVFIEMDPAPTVSTLFMYIYVLYIYIHQFSPTR